jgi:hypothetical protein
VGFGSVCAAVIPVVVGFGPGAVRLASNSLSGSSASFLRHSCPHRRSARRRISRAWAGGGRERGEAAVSVAAKAPRNVWVGRTAVLLLKGIKPEKYRERSTVDLNQMTYNDYRNVPVAELRRRLAQLREEQDGLGLPTIEVGIVPLPPEGEP